MQGIIDATCRDCGQIISWDTNMPRLCDDCLGALSEPNAATEAETHDEPVEVPA